MEFKLTLVTFSMAIILGFIIGLVYALARLEEIELDNRIILSEIRDSNYIMACDDVNKVESPERYDNCTKK